MLAVAALLLSAAGVAPVLTLERSKVSDFAGHVGTATRDMIIAAGFGIDQVNITGHRFTSDSEIFDTLDLPNVRTFADLDSDAALKRIERLPWVDTAQITRAYPGTLEIAIRERMPSVVWTRGDRSYLVDATGRVLGPVVQSADWALPRVVGEGAGAEAAVMLAALRRFPAIEHEYAYGERIAERRWRVVLRNGTILDLGADREMEGLEEIAQSRAVAPAIKGAPMIVDVRTPGRIAIRPAGDKPAKTASLIRSPLSRP